MTGIPYARADVVTHDGRSYYTVKCPRCGDTFAGTGRTEDLQTKDATRLYAAHYDLRHA